MGEERGFPQGKGELMRKVIWKIHRVLTSCAKLTVFSTKLKQGPPKSG